MLDDVDISEWEAAAEEQERDERTKKGDATRGRLRKIDAKDAPVRQPYTFTHVADLEITEPEFLIDGWVEKGTFGEIVGAPATLKSFLAIEKGCCVGAGMRFHGCEVEQGSVFYIAAEGRGGISRRIEAWARKHGVDRSKIRLFVSDKGARFLDPENAASVAQAILDLAAIHGPPSLIIVDTLARNFGPGDENSTQDMNKFVAAMDDLRGNWPDCVLIVVHHSGWEAKRRARGSSSNYAALDFEYILERKDKHSPVCVINTKMKEAAERADEWFMPEVIDLGIVDKKGELVTSIVLVPSEGSESDGAGKLGKNGTLGRDAYITAAAVHGVWGDDGLEGVSEADWRAAFYEVATGIQPGSRPRTFKRAQEELAKASMIAERDGLHLALDAAAIMEIDFKRGKPDKVDRTGQS